MNWFERLCRNTGLMIHHARHPDKKTKVVRHETEETKVSENVTLRRTIIEEIEIKGGERPVHEPPPGTPPGTKDTR